MLRERFEARLARWPILSRLFLAIAAGIVMGLGQRPYDLPFLLFLAFPLLILLARSGGVASAAFTGWAGGIGYFALTLSWIVEPFLVDIARHGWMAPFALVGLSAGLAVFWAAAFGLAARFGKNRRPGVVSLALAIAGAEFLRANVLTGFPWALPAYAWVNTPLAQAAAWIGPHGLTLVLLGIAALLAYLRPVPALIGFSAIAALWFGGTVRVDSPVADTDRPVVRLVQPNAAQHLKWRADMQQEFYTRLVRATEAAPEADLVVWPETAVPFLLGDRSDLMEDIALAAGQDTRVVMGIRRWEEPGDWFNSLIVMGPDGDVTAVYDKWHLVPFGEYLPLTGLIDAIGLGAWASGMVGSFTPGDGPSRIDLPGIGSFQPLICYEAIFPEEILRGEDRPDFLMQITNDAWFGTWSGPYQHLAQARMRAIEQGLPLFRSANTGISAAIDPFGRVVAQIGLGGAGHVDASLPAPLPPTLYARTGDGLFMAFWALSVLVGGVVAYVRRSALTARPTEG